MTSYLQVATLILTIAAAGALSAAAAHPNCEYYKRELPWLPLPPECR